ncbi:hypothetical protein IFM89_005402 [Coptis chinensis]|uniref:Plus3 domain-containing protein n=1 Tax=Coptis chinensis TaxID=261450 RepID=A0A835IW87_9MAGN|nr:hypothetical protein IFM89_005402 [Coptis chinensis]
MDDLESLLLEAAGRTGPHGRNLHPRSLSSRQQEASYNNESDSNDDDLGHDTLKPSRSNVPLKKRLDPIEKDDDNGSLSDGCNYGVDNVDGGSDESDVGSDLYKDDYDREQLAQLTELQREMILSDRAQKRDEQRLRDRVRPKQRGKKSQVLKGTPEPTPSRVRSSARFSERVGAKDDALNELRAKRLKKQDLEGHRKLREVSRGNLVDQDAPSVRRNSVMGAQSSDSSQSENQSPSYNKDEESAGEEDLDDSDEGKSDNEDTLMLEDIKEITIRRSQLARWFKEPFFGELIVGCFVRVGIGMKDNRACYRLCIVKNVDATEPNKQYRMENKNTNKYLNVTWGTLEARWQMSVISETPPLEEEFREWVQAMKHAGVQMPTCKQLLEKREAIQKATAFVYSSATVKKMLEEKKSASSRPLNIAAEKERLRREMDVAENELNREEVERIKARLQELEASRQTKGKDLKAVRLAEMNKKNRAENFKNASEKKPVNTSLKAGEEGYDPFSRRWTKSRNYFVSNPVTEDSKNGHVAAESLESGGGNGAAGVAGTTNVAVFPPTAAAGARKLVDTKAPVDQGTVSNSLHNFNLPISLAVLKNFGGPDGFHLGFMARKQRIEASIGCKVPENDGRMHSLTLTISDYKRRRGVLTEL